MVYKTEAGCLTHTLCHQARAGNAAGEPGHGSSPPPQLRVLLVRVGFQALGYPVPDLQQAAPRVLQLLLHAEPLVRLVQLLQRLLHGPHPLLALQGRRDISPPHPALAAPCTPREHTAPLRPHDHLWRSRERKAGQQGKTFESEKLQALVSAPPLRAVASTPYFASRTLLLPHLPEGHS